MSHAPSTARELMDRFASVTGLTSDARQRRYLWTDAYAVCNWIGLGEIDRAEALAHQVHATLGRHRSDDTRTGWISGLPDDDGARRPTAGGLRIGKPLPERTPDQPYEAQLEWDRDGQYFHYLTRWMRALTRLNAATGEDRYREWAVELGRVAFRHFGHGIGPVPSRLHWKMSIDLSRPLVPSIGQHDPLDGYVAFSEVRAADRSADTPPLTEEIGLLAGMGDGAEWTTDDPLGTGALLADAWVLARLDGSTPQRQRTLERVIAAAALSLREVGDSAILDLPAHRRTAFRELGLAIGLAAIERLADERPPGERYLEELREAAPLRHRITDFWLDDENRRAPTWVEHDDISTVMLATAVSPAGYLGAMGGDPG